MIRPFTNRAWLAVPLAGALAFTMAATADVLVGPTLDNNIAGWPNSGMQFEALVDVELVEVTFNNQGVADTIHFWDRTTNSLLATIPVDAGNGGALVVPIGINLITGHQYSLQNDGPDNGRWTSYTSYPTFNDHLSASGVRSDDGSIWTTWWFTFTHLTTGTGTYSLTYSGGCPSGSGTVSWRNAQPGSSQGLVVGTSQGSFTIPNNSPCPGTVLGITGQVQLVDPPGIFSTGSGQGSVSGRVGTSACGRFLQLVHGGSCETSNVVRIE